MNAFLGRLFFFIAEFEAAPEQNPAHRRGAALLLGLALCRPVVQ